MFSESLTLDYIGSYDGWCGIKTPLNIWLYKCLAHPRRLSFIFCPVHIRDQVLNTFVLCLLYLTKQTRLNIGIVVWFNRNIRLLFYLIFERCCWKFIIWFN